MKLFLTVIGEAYIKFIIINHIYIQCWGKLLFKSNAYSIYFIFYLFLMYPLFYQDSPIEIKISSSRESWPKWQHKKVSHV